MMRDPTGGRREPGRATRRLLWPGLAALLVIPLALDWPGRAFAIAAQWMSELRLPRALDSIPARMLMGFSALVLAVLVVAFIVKLVEVRRARSWSVAKGRILSSEATTEIVSSGNDAGTVRKVPAIRYEFSVGEKRYVGERVSLAERIPDEEVAALVARYPEGRYVDVYYDPASPASSVLDREPMPRLLVGCAVALAAGIGFVVLAMWAVTSGPTLVRSWLPQSEPLAFLIAGALGGLFLWLGIVGGREANRARSWPKVPARIERSEVVTVSRPRGKMHGPSIAYRYSVGGREHVGHNVWLNETRYGTQRFAERIVARYPVGEIVMVHVSPEKPEVAALEISSTFGWILCGIGLVGLGLAAIFSGQIGFKW